MIVYMLITQKPKLRKRNHPLEINLFNGCNNIYHRRVWSLNLENLLRKFEYGCKRDSLNFFWGLNITFSIRCLHHIIDLISFSHIHVKKYIIFLAKMHATFLHFCGFVSANLYKSIGFSFSLSYFIFFINTFVDIILFNIRFILVMNLFSSKKEITSTSWYSQTRDTHALHDRLAIVTGWDSDIGKIENN